MKKVYSRRRTYLASKTTRAKPSQLYGNATDNQPSTIRKTWIRCKTCQNFKKSIESSISLIH